MPAVLVDDVQFIREVREGVEVAPDMDPASELNKLKKKFEIWKREFKVGAGGGGRVQGGGAKGCKWGGMEGSRCGRVQGGGAWWIQGRGVEGSR